MPSQRSGQIVLIFIIASLLLHAIVFGVASQLKWEPPLPPEPEKPRTITLRRMEPPPPPEPEAPPMPDQFVPTLASQETVEPDPNSPLISERNTQARTQEQPTDRNSPMPEMSGQERRALNYQNIAGTPGVQPGVPGQQPTPPTKPQPQQPPQEQAEPKEEPKEPTEQKQEEPVESEVVEKMEKVEKPQDGKGEEKVEIAKVNPNDVPLRPEREFSPDAMPLLAPEARREKARPMQRVEDPERPTPRPVTPPRPSGGFSASRIRSDVRGGGTRGENSAGSRASAEGRFMAKLYRSVGSYWYQYIAQKRQLVRVGTIEITFFLHADGRISQVRTSGDSTGGNNPFLEAVSKQAIMSIAPFDEFPPEMREKYGDGFTHSFEFSMY